MMPRRTFVATATLAAASATARAQSTRKKAVAPEHYELRRYQLRNGAGAKVVADYLAEALVPALGRAGVNNVGVFQTMIGPDMPSTWLLLAHESAAGVTTTPQRLAADAVFRKAPARLAYEAATAESPAYVRIESSLLVALDHMPRLVAPAQDKPRVFELRTYESATEASSLKKQEMFTRMGETEIFRRVGLTPVLFARTVIGPRQPSFSYLLTYPDLNARNKAWETFIADPEWLKLRATAGYSDAELVTNISGVLLRPAPSSKV